MTVTLSTQKTCCQKTYVKLFVRQYLKIVTFKNMVLNLLTISLFLIVCLGTSVQNHGPVMLTAKNLQCMRALLILAHCHGSILGSSWHLVLTTLQVK